MDNLPALPQHRPTDFIGRPAYRITPEVIARAEELATLGMPKVWIAKGLGISEDTLQRKIKAFAAFAEAIERGQAKALAAAFHGLSINAHTPTKMNPGGNVLAQLGIIDRIAGKPGAPTDENNGEVEEVIFRRRYPQGPPT